MTTSGYIHAGDHQLHFLKYGQGSKLLLAFHGYGNDAAIFSDIVGLLVEKYTVISFDLPFHGATTGWQQDALFSKEALAALVQNALKEFSATKCSLMGYSMGGRVCLNIIELLPDIVADTLLIAPDGLSFNYFYYFVTHPKLGKSLFRKFLLSPTLYAPVMNSLRKLHLLDASRYKFVMHYLESESSRKMLLNVWPAMRLLIPGLEKVRKNIRGHSLQVHIFMGLYDRVIPVKLGEKFIKEMPSVQLHVVEKGHKLFDKKTLEAMAAVLL